MPARCPQSRAESSLHQRRRGKGTGGGLPRGPGPGGVPRLQRGGDLAPVWAPGGRVAEFPGRRSGLGSASLTLRTGRTWRKALWPPAFGVNCWIPALRPAYCQILPRPLPSSPGPGTPSGPITPPPGVFPWHFVTAPDGSCHLGLEFVVDSFVFAIERVRLSGLISPGCFSAAFGVWPWIGAQHASVW